jgi:hypothetical protein
LIATILFALRLLGPAGMAVLLLLAYYEGVPGVNRLPYVDSLPFVREFGVGRVELERRDAVRGLVRQSEIDALSAVLQQERAKTAAAEAMVTQERKRAAAALRLKEAQRAEIERLIEEAKESPGLTYPSEEDIRWHPN